MSAIDPIPYSDAKLRRILSTVRTIAMVGASSNWNRPSYFVMKYLQGKGYRVIPVNPGIAGKQHWAKRSTPSLRDIPEKVDMVDIFRASDQVGPIVDDAIAIGAKVVWMQLASATTRRRAKAEAAGIEVVMNRCPRSNSAVWAASCRGAASIPASSAIARPSRRLNAKPSPHPLPCGQRQLRL